MIQDTETEEGDGPAPTYKNPSVMQELKGLRPPSSARGLTIFARHLQMKWHQAGGLEEIAASPSRWVVAGAGVRFELKCPVMGPL